MGSLSSISPAQRTLVKELDSCVDKQAQEFIYGLRTDLRSGWDRIVLGTGRRGVGKSTIFMILSKLIDYYFHLGRLAFAPDEIIPIFRSMPEFSAMDADEGIEMFGRHDWMTQTSRSVIKQVVGDRYLHSFRGVLAPTIFNFNQSLIEMADYWIVVNSPDGRLRGYAEIRQLHPPDYVKRKIPYAPAIYDLEFDDLPKNIAEAYQKLKAQKGEERALRTESRIQDEMYGKKDQFISAEVVAAEIRENPQKFTTEGKFDHRKIYAEYAREGFGSKRSHDLAFIMNNELDDEQMT